MQTVVVTRLLNGFVLAGVNMAAVIAGFIAYHFLKPINQIAVQVPIAAGLCVVGFCVWVLLGRTRAFQKFAVRDNVDFAWIWLTAFAWCPIILVPLHYFTQGYLTAFSNIVSMWIFQFFVNTLAVGVTAGMWHRVEDRARTEAMLTAPNESE